MRTTLACTVFLALAAPTFAAAQAPLPTGATSQGMLSMGEAATYTFQATAAGFLAVVLRAEAGEDLSFTVTDAEGQALPEGRADMDFGGNVGAEQMVVTISEPGAYRVIVESLAGEPASFQIGGSFLSSALAALAADPDGKPSAARELAVGASHVDTIDPSAGDRWDWYRIPVTQSGVLTILTRVEGEGDLRLERFEEGSFREAVDASDQDMDGVLGNESLTLDVQAGQVVFVRVLPSFGGSQAVAYRLASGIIPG